MNIVVASAAVPGWAPAGLGRQSQSAAAHLLWSGFIPVSVRILDCWGMSPSVIGDWAFRVLVEVVQARSRQLAQAQAELLAGLVEIAHAVAVADTPGKRPGTQAGEEAGQRAEAEAETVARAGKRFEWAAHGACHDFRVSHG